jgi:hypothetical protein
VDSVEEVQREEVGSEGGINTGKSVNMCAKWGGTSTMNLLNHPIMIMIIFIHQETGPPSTTFCLSN